MSRSSWSRSPLFVFSLKRGHIILVPLTLHNLDGILSHGGASALGTFLQRVLLFLSPLTINWVGCKLQILSGKLGSFVLSCSVCSLSPHVAGVTQGSGEDKGSLSTERGALPLGSLVPPFQWPLRAPFWQTSASSAWHWLCSALRIKAVVHGELPPAGPASQTFCLSRICQLGFTRQDSCWVCAEPSYPVAQKLELGPVRACPTMETETSLRFWREMQLKLQSRSEWMSFPKHPFFLNKILSGLSICFFDAPQENFLRTNPACFLPGKYLYVPCWNWSRFVCLYFLGVTFLIYGSLIRDGLPHPGAQEVCSFVLNAHLGTSHQVSGAHPWSSPVRVCLVVMVLLRSLGWDHWSWIGSKSVSST